MEIKIKKGCVLALFFLVTTVIFIPSLSNINVFDIDKFSDKNERFNFDYNNLKSSQVSSNIYIDGDQDWADFKSNGNCTGLGTFSDPYIIKDLVIDCKNTGSGIIIENSTAYFKIVNVTIYNSGKHWLNINAGIKLQSSNNGFLINNTVGNNDYGIALLDSNNTLISGNIVNYSFFVGGGGGGISLFHSNNNTISENAMYNKISYGLNLYNGNNNIISGNTVSNNRDTGIIVSKSNNTLISGNTVIKNRGIGILLIDCDNTKISGNIANNNDVSGIIVDISNNTLISGNNLSDNRFVGIELYQSNENTISHNKLTYSLQNGIRLYQSNANTISYNNITYIERYGIYLEESNTNLILGNILLYNIDSINERNCAGNIYQNNIIDENPVFPILIVAPIFIGIIFLIAIVVFINKKRVRNQKQQIR